MSKKEFTVSCKQEWPGDVLEIVTHEDYDQGLWLKESSPW